METSIVCPQKRTRPCSPSYMSWHGTSGRCVPSAAFPARRMPIWRAWKNLRCQSYGRTKPTKHRRFLQMYHQECGGFLSHRGTPKLSILKGFSLKHPLWGTPNLGKSPIWNGLPTKNIMISDRAPGPTIRLKLISRDFLPQKNLVISMKSSYDFKIIYPEYDI